MRKVAETLIQKTHVTLSTALKPLKRALLGQGSMMRFFHLIREAALEGDVETLRRIHVLLLNTMPHFWQGRYEKQLQLILLCRFCLAHGRQRDRVYHELVPLLHDYAHELTREISIFLAEANQ
jgi:hypothetical protein